MSHSFDDIPAGSVCTVTETADGASDTIIVTVSGNGQTVTIPAATVVPVSLIDGYDDGSAVEEVPDEPGSPAVDATGILTVIKHITGRGYSADVHRLNDAAGASPEVSSPLGRACPHLASAGSAVGLSAPPADRTPRRSRARG